MHYVSYFLTDESNSLINAVYSTSYRLSAWAFSLPKKIDPGVQVELGVEVIKPRPRITLVSTPTFSSKQIENWTRHCNSPEA